jgi:hypothetical protein
MLNLQGPLPCVVANNPHPSIVAFHTQLAVVTDLNGLGA